MDNYQKLIQQALTASEFAPADLREVTYEIVLKTLLETNPDVVPSSGLVSRAKAPSPRSHRDTSPAEFLREVAPSGGLETLVTLCYYLDHYLGEAEFTPKRINELAVKAKIKTIHPQYVSNAVKQGYLAEATGRTYRLTQSGEKLVESRLAQGGGGQ